MKQIQLLCTLPTLFGIAIFQVKIYRQGLSHQKIGAIENKVSNTNSFNYVPPERFDREDLISRVAKGDKDAAFQLATYYGRERLSEAAFYWFGTAIKLGHKGMSKESLEIYEHSIIGELEK